MCRVETGSTVRQVVRSVHDPTSLALTETEKKPENYSGVTRTNGFGLPTLIFDVRVVEDISEDRWLPSHLAMFATWAKVLLHFLAIKQTSVTSDLLPGFLLCSGETTHVWALLFYSRVKDKCHRKKKHSILKE